MVSCFARHEHPVHQASCFNYFIVNPFKVHAKHMLAHLVTCIHTDRQTYMLADRHTNNTSKHTCASTHRLTDRYTYILSHPHTYMHNAHTQTYIHADSLIMRIQIHFTIHTISEWLTHSAKCQVKKQARNKRFWHEDRILTRVLRKCPSCSEDTAN